MVTVLDELGNVNDVKTNYDDSDYFDFVDNYNDEGYCYDYYCLDEGWMNYCVKMLKKLTGGTLLGSLL